MTAPDSPIPIRNIYRMLLYAWNVLDECDPEAVESDGPTSLADLFGLVLCNEMEPILRRGLEQSYVEHEEVLAGIRGRIMIGPTVLQRLDQRGRAHCRFDERSPDVPINRLVKATATLLLRASHLHSDVADRLHVLRRHLHDVTDVRPDNTLLRQVHLHRNNRRYRLPVSVCRFVLREL